MTRKARRRSRPTGPAPESPTDSTDSVDLRPLLLVAVLAWVYAGCDGATGEGSAGGDAAEGDTFDGNLAPSELFVRVETGAPVSDGSFTRGVAWGDFDRDGDPDLVVANTADGPELLYRNEGDGTYRTIDDTPIAQAAGDTEGVHWLDYDNDGDLDLLAVNNHDQANVLFRNDGDGAFVSADAGDLTSDVESSSHACWADFDGDGDLDVFVVNREEEDDALYENRGGGTFRRSDRGPWIGLGGEGRTCGTGDADGDGLAEIYVGNFLGQDNVLYRNRGGLEFRRVTEGDAVQDGGRTYGISWVDYDGDGDLDLFVTNIAREDRNLLYENDGAGNLTRRQDLVIVTDSRGPSKGHAWGDYDNDGDIDLFVANGTENTEDVPDYDVANFLYLNHGDGTFERLVDGPVATDRRISAGVAWADHDRDGDLDLYVANWGGGAEDNDLYRNLTTERTDRAWLILELRGDRHRTAVGARVRAWARVDGPGTPVLRQVRWLLPATGYASQNEAVVHFGLGLAERVDSLEIRWPSGTVNAFTDLPVRRVVSLTEGDDEVPEDPGEVGER